MEMLQEQLTVAADRSRLAELRKSLRLLCQQSGVEPRTIHRIVLCVDESVSNIMEHSGLAPDALIRISLEFADERVAMEIRDEGRAFDPCEHDVDAAPRGTDHRSHFKRGFGLYLIHLIADLVEYTRTPEGENVLSITIEAS